MSSIDLGNRVEITNLNYGIGRGMEISNDRIGDTGTVEFIGNTEEFLTVSFSYDPNNWLVLHNSEVKVIDDMV